MQVVAKAGFTVVSFATACLVCGTYACAYLNCIPVPRVQWRIKFNRHRILILSSTSNPDHFLTLVPLDLSLLKTAILNITEIAIYFYLFLESPLFPLWGIIILLFHLNKSLMPDRPDPFPRLPQRGGYARLGCG